MPANKIIEVNGLSVTFGNRKILTDISFEAYHGEVTVILGGSGSGKTTILKHLLGLYNLQEGYVSILGKNIDEIDESEQKQLYLQMGVFYQNGGLLNSLTVGENVSLPLEQHTRLPADLIKKIVLMKLHLVHLEGVYELYPSQLSGGMLKRAALARAMVMDPPLLFCDEPGAGLDPISLASLDKLILDLRGQLGMSIIIITHEVSSILRIADRIVFVDEGKIIFKGPLKEALQSKNSEVHEFFNSASN
jgi:phospholipid/cholesterol/gamma-HCH transport system ATP-binding protein